MMESKAGSILLLISGILTLIAALLILIIGFVFAFFSSNTEGARGDSTIAAVFLLILFVVMVALGILKLYAYSMMKDPKKTVKGGIIALVTGILSFGDLLAIIGGILGIVQGSEK